MQMTGWVIYFAHNKSFMVVLTQPVMQIRWVVINSENPHDADSLVQIKHNFIRQRGFTVQELLAIPPSHEVFEEDETLKDFTARLKRAVNGRIAPLLDAIFPEENDRPLHLRMGKRRVMTDFLEQFMRKKGESPCGARTSFRQWAESPGGAASKLWYILPGLTFTVRLQMERSGNQVMTTQQKLLPSLQQQGRQPQPTPQPPPNPALPVQVSLRSAGSDHGGTACCRATVRRARARAP